MKHTVHLHHCYYFYDALACCLLFHVCRVLLIVLVNVVSISMNRYFLATPEVSITGIYLTDEFVNITWALIQGHIESVSLGWMEYVESSGRKKRSVVDGYIILESGIPPGHTTIYVTHQFNTSVDNQFTIFAYEGDGMTSTGESPSNQGLILVNPTQLPTG